MWKIKDVGSVFGFLALLIILTINAIPKPAPEPVRKKEVRCVNVPPEAVHSHIVENAKVGFILKDHIEILRSTHTCSVVLIFEK